MSGFRPFGSPMRAKSSSAGSQRMSPTEAPEANHPLIHCPQCQIPVIKLRSKKKETYNWIFYKCPNNYQNDDTCGYYWWEDEYVAYLRAREQKQRQLQLPEEHEAVEDGADLKHALMEMRQQISEVKVQMGELKQEMRQEKGHVVLDRAILVALFVGVAVGILATLGWK